MKRAFKDPITRTAFVKSMLDELNRKCTFGSLEERLKANLISVNNIAKLFGLRDTCCKPLKDDYDVFETLHKDNDGNEYFILQNIHNKEIRIGDSKDIVENWDELFAK